METFLVFSAAAIILLYITYILIVIVNQKYGDHNAFNTTKRKQ